MAKKSTIAASTPKRTRKAHPKYFRVNLAGVSQPKIVVSTTKKAAVFAVLNIEEAHHTDLMDAGRHDWDIIDLTKPPQQTSLLREAQALQHPGGADKFNHRPDDLVASSYPVV